MRRYGAAAALTALGLAGCATDNNTLIFGTATTIGADVSAAPTQGGSPQLTLGYKRSEGVWMPLRPVPSKPSGTAGDTPTGEHYYQSQNNGKDGQVRTDAYSVFASIGAKFNGGAGATSGVNAGAGVAQFFATGAAAVNLTANPALVTTLKVDDPQSTEAQAEAVKAVAKNETLTSVREGVAEDDLKQIELETKTRQAQRERRISLVMTCAITADGGYRWAEIVEKTPQSAEQKAVLKQLSQTELPAFLRANPSLITPALTAGAQAPFNCQGS